MFKEKGMTAKANDVKNFNKENTNVKHIGFKRIAWDCPYCSYCLHIHTKDGVVVDLTKAENTIQNTNEDEKFLEQLRKLTREYDGYISGEESDEGYRVTEKTYKAKMSYPESEYEGRAIYNFAINKKDGDILTQVLRTQRMKSTLKEKLAENTISDETMEKLQKAQTMEEARQHLITQLRQKQMNILLELVEFDRKDTAKQIKFLAETFLEQQHQGQLCPQTKKQLEEMTK